MLHVASEIIIKAPPSIVWEVITDMQYYRDWNSQFSLISGEVKADAKVKLKFSPLYYKGYTARPKIHRFMPIKIFGWKGLTMLPGIIDGEYLFRLTEMDDDTTKLNYSQRYTGLLSFLLPHFQMFRDARRSCIKLNAEIKRRVEEVFIRERDAPLTV